MLLVSFCLFILFSAITLFTSPRFQVNKLAVLITKFSFLNWYSNCMFISLQETADHQDTSETSELPVNSSGTNSSSSSGEELPETQDSDTPCRTSTVEGELPKIQDTHASGGENFSSSFGDMPPKPQDTCTLGRTSSFGSCRGTLTGTQDTNSPGGAISSSSFGEELSETQSSRIPGNASSFGQELPGTQDTHSPARTSLSSSFGEELPGVILATGINSFSSSFEEFVTSGWDSGTPGISSSFQEEPPTTPDTDPPGGTGSYGDLKNTDVVGMWSMFFLNFSHTPPLSLSFFSFQEKVFVRFSSSLPYFFSSGLYISSIQHNPLQKLYSFPILVDAPRTHSSPFIVSSFAFI